MNNTWRLPNNILEIHKKTEMKLSPICCDLIEEYKKNFNWILRKRPTTTLKNMIENIGESKKDFSISAGSICLLCSTKKLPNLGLWKDRKYNFDIEKDIVFLWNNKYKISIPGEKYKIPGTINNPDINIILEYEPQTWKIIYQVPGESKWVIILNKTNLINPLTLYQDKVAKTKINFRAQNKDFELILDFPIKTANSPEYNENKIVA